MQGYILHITKAKNEDLIITTLTANKLYTLYRFYGARHSSINLGYKIDFTIEYQLGFLPKLRNVTHLGFSWLKDTQKHSLWQQFIKLYHRHLQGLEEIDSFYIELLDKIALKITKQNPKRAIIEGYVELLEYEGRLHKEFVCSICAKRVDTPALRPTFLPAHPQCIKEEGFSAFKLSYLYNYKSALFFDDQEIQRLWEILLRAL